MTTRVRQVLTDLKEDRRQSKQVSLYVWGHSANIIKPIRKAAKKAKVSEANQHRLRDTFGTRCFDKGIPAQEVQKLLGHKTMAMTMRYARVSDVRLHDAIKRLEA